MLNPTKGMGTKFLKTGRKLLYNLCKIIIANKNEYEMPYKYQNSCVLTKSKEKYREYFLELF